MSDLRGAYLDAGSPIAEIADTGRMRIRMYVHEYVIDRVRPGLRVHLLLDGAFSRLVARVTSIEPSTQTLPPALETIQKVKGGAELQYYVVNAGIDNDGTLLDGRTGTAKIVVGRRSLATILWQETREFVERKIW